MKLYRVPYQNMYSGCAGSIACLLTEPTHAKRMSRRRTCNHRAAHGKPDSELSLRPLDPPSGRGRSMILVVSEDSTRQITIDQIDNQGPRTLH